MRLPCAIGAVVAPFAGRQTPLSGQDSPVRAVVPIGFFIFVYQLHGKTPYRKDNSVRNRLSR